MRVGRWSFVAASAISAATVVMAGTTIPVAAASNAPTIVVSGKVAKPATWAVADLQSITNRTVEVQRPGGTDTHTERGVLLLDLVSRSTPQVDPSVKNGNLRGIVTVHGRDGTEVTFALGELDPNFGNRAVLLSFAEDGVSTVGTGARLIVPGDNTTDRWVANVDRITVDFVNPTKMPPPAGLFLVDGTGVGLSGPMTASQVAALPQQKATVTFTAGTTTETHTESGPTFLDVLHAAGTTIKASTVVAAVGSDGYVAVVSPNEQAPGGRTILISTIEDDKAQTNPRLVVGGDVRGGRYVSGVVRLFVVQGASGTDHPPSARDSGLIAVGADGGVLTTGNAQFGGAVTANLQPGRHAIGIGETAANGSYWVAADDGSVFSLGTAPFLGSAIAIAGFTHATGFAVTPTRQGYAVLGADGSVFTQGDAQALGTPPDDAGTEMVAMAFTASGNGYVILGADGSVFQFGDAVGLPVPAKKAHAVAVATTSSGGGYSVLYADGSIVGVGDGPSAAKSGNGSAIALVLSSTTDGYRIVFAGGSVTSVGLPDLKPLTSGALGGAITGASSL